MGPEHRFDVAVRWDGNRGEGTSSYRSFGREVTVTATGKADIAGSAARVFHGNADRWNPEEELLAALAQCHLLSYLHVATRAGIRVEAYEDAASGTLLQEGAGGRFTEVVLRPVVTIRADGDADAAVEIARGLHAEANAVCFIAASVNFPVRHEPEIRVLGGESA